MKIVYEDLLAIADELESDITTTYSGRGMFGGTCVGIKIDNLTEMLVIGRAIAENIEDESLKAVLLNGARVDSMGYGSIVYWETLSCDDAPDEDEDEDY